MFRRVDRMKSGLRDMSTRRCARQWLPISDWRTITDWSLALLHASLGMML
jgi:hypothetical protein